MKDPETRCGLKYHRIHPSGWWPGTGISNQLPQAHEAMDHNRIVELHEAKGKKGNRDV